jgi:peptide-methionine (R)-S-oxide reductase
VRIAIKVLPVLAAPDTESALVGELEIGARVRVMERQTVADGSHLVKVGLHGNTPLRELGWVLCSDTHGSQSLPEVRCARALSGVEPSGEAAHWIAGLSDLRQRNIETAWLAVLGVERFCVLRMRGTEEAHTGELTTHAVAGCFHCAGCARPLYLSEHKFTTTSGWPSFSENIPGALERREDRPNMRQSSPSAPEIVCASCGGHVGHVYTAASHPPPRQERHCANSASLRFCPRSEAAFSA